MYTVPVGQKNPAEQTSHWDLWKRLWLSLNVPAGQAFSEDVGDRDPTWHTYLAQQKN